MPAVHPSPDVLAELERRIQSVEPAAFLVPARILRRVIHQHRHPSGLGLRVPHAESYVLETATLLDLVDRAELGVGPSEELPARAVLLERPDAGEVARRGLNAALVHGWRLLFHARIHVALDDKIACGKLDQAAVERRIRDLGSTEFDEIRAVLQEERLLLPPADDVCTYCEFAATYLEFRSFAPGLVAHWFPALTDLAAVDALLAEDVDGPELFARTRPEGALDPGATAAGSLRLRPAERPNDRELPGAESGNGADAGSLLNRALTAGKKGNLVRAAIARVQAASLTPPGEAQRLFDDAARDLERLVQRLQAAVSLADAEAAGWRELLPLLLPGAARGFWTAEARLLYDLQNVCIDQEREIYAVDLVEWGLSLGRRPLQRPLPGHREVRVVRHLRSAARLLLAAKLGERDRQQFSQLFQDTIHRAESRLRDYFRPMVEQAMHEVGLRPANLPERVARTKVIEELLDQVNERGFLTMSDLRDALSRNQLKLPDLAGPKEFLLGDRLILLNRRLALALDGVYQRGEIYRRWLQRLSSVAFGTRPGRFLTRYLALPFGGAFIALEGVGHLLVLVQEHVFGWHGHHMHLTHAWSVALLGFFLVGMLYVAGFRRNVARGLLLTGRVLHLILLGGPTWLLRHPPLSWLLDNVLMRWLRALFRPLLAAAVATGLALWSGLEAWTAIGLGAAVFVLAAVFLSSRLYRDLEETFAEQVVRFWEHVGHDLLPGMFRFVMDIFKRFLDGVERLLYTVDEWFRFRSGQGRLLLVVKAVFGFVWFLITYVVRFCLNLLVEPQINPIKHFPVVTVSHKLLWAFLPNLIDLFSLTMDRQVALAVAPVVLSIIPGIFGFLVWELKENWRLYEANRPRSLEAVVVGSHGETVLRLLKPGFHSGTLPKTFRKLRRAERRHRRRATRRALHALHHLEAAVRHFVERELLVLLRYSKAWNNLPLTLRKVSLATNRIAVTLWCSRWPDDNLRLHLDLQSGRLVARTREPGWLADLSEEQRRALDNALAGLCQFAGVMDGGTISWQQWVEVWESTMSPLAFPRFAYQPRNQGPN